MFLLKNCIYLYVIVGFMFLADMKKKFLIDVVIKKKKKSVAL